MAKKIVWIIFLGVFAGFLLLIWYGGVKIQMGDRYPTIYLSEDCRWMLYPDYTENISYAGVQFISQGSIQLWCQYPYICGYGYVGKNKVLEYFVIDITNKNIQRMSKNEINSFLSREKIEGMGLKYKGFSDLKGPFGDEEKLIELQNEVQGKGKKIPLREYLSDWQTW